MNLKLKYIIMKFQKLYTKLQTATHLTINFVIWPSLTKLLSIWVFNILIWVSLEKSNFFSAVPCTSWEKIKIQHIASRVRKA